MKIEIDANGDVVFKTGGSVVNGNIDAWPGNSISFECSNYFVLFIKDFVARRAKARKTPYIHRPSRTSMPPSPDDDDQLSFVARPTGGSFKVTLHLKDAAHLPRGTYSYGVVVVDDSGHPVATRDPQIIIQ